MKRNPLLLILLLLVAAIAVGDCFLPYGPFRPEPHWPAEARTWQGIVTQQPRATAHATQAVVRLTHDGSLVQLTAVNDTPPQPRQASPSSVQTSPSSSQASPNSAETPSSSAETLPSSGETSQKLDVGRLVVFHGTIAQPHNAGNPGEMDYAAHLRRQGITGQCFCFAPDWRCLGPAPSLTLRERMLILREQLTDVYAQHFEGEMLAIVSAMSLGDRSRVDTSLRELYNRCGASHVLALSGLHLSILCWMLGWVLLVPLRRYERAGTVVGSILLLAVLWTFVLLAGLPLSLLRAATMFTIMTLLPLLSHRSPPYHSLILTLIIMLAWNPAQLFDVGFQLSAISVAAIIFVDQTVRRSPQSELLRLIFSMQSIPLQRRWNEHFAQRTQAGQGTALLPQLATPRRRLHTLLARVATSRRWLQAGRLVLLFLLVSFAAQMGTMPLVAHYFGRISLAGFVSSFLVIPAAYAVLFGALAYLLLVPLRGPIAWALSSLLSAVHTLMAGLSDLPCATFDVTLSWWGVAWSYALLMWLAYSIFLRRVRSTALEQNRRRLAYAFRTTAVAALLVLLLVGGESVIAAWQRPPMQVAIYNRTDRSEIHLVTPTTDSIADVRSPHRVGHVLLFAQQKVAIVDFQMPYVADVAMPDPLEVDVLLVSRGAKGHLSDMLRRYKPSLVALDGCLGHYFRQRFAEEASVAGLPVYDVHEQGALILAATPADRR